MDRRQLSVCDRNLLRIVEQVAGAQNLVQFYVWFIFLVSLLTAHPEVSKVLAKSPEIIPSKTHRTIDVTFDTLAVISLVWYGWMVTASILLAHIFLVQWSLTAAQNYVLELLKGNGDA